MMIQSRKTDSFDDAEEHSMSRANRRPSLFRFSPELNTGTIIQIFVIVAGMLLGYSRINETLSLTQARTLVIEERATEQKKISDTNIAELRSDVKDIGSKVSDLKTQINLLDLKLSQPRK